MRRLLLIALVLVPIAPASARADDQGKPIIFVPRDHVLAARPFPVLAVDLGPRTTVGFKLERGDRVEQLGRFRVATNGRVRSSLAVPAGFPDGYAKLVATGSDGANAETWILVGERTESRPSGSGGGTSWHDPKVLLLVVVLAVVVAGLVAIAARARG